MDQIKYVVSIAETGSFSATAERLYISQPAVSKHIADLEWELGGALFNREHRQVALSPLGEKLYPLMKRIVTQIDEVMQEARAYTTHKETVKLASLPIMGQYHITEALQLFETEHGNISVEVTELEERDLIASLDAGDCDVAIIREELFPAGRYVVQRLVEDRLALFVNEKNPLAKQTSVMPEMLRAEPLMLMPKYTSVYQLCMGALRGGKPNVLSCARIETIISNVESGRCSALLMAKTQEVFRSTSVKLIPLEPECISNIAVVCTARSEQKQAVRDFIAFLTHYFTPGPGL
ncbi:MAG: LysR family transcriptional regulator [Treponema sp.]|nr:LysR family transcriptional regulator [Treponema sp.]